LPGVSVIGLSPEKCLEDKIFGLTGFKVKVRELIDVKVKENESKVVFWFECELISKPVNYDFGVVRWVKKDEVLPNFNLNMLSGFPDKGFEFFQNTLDKVRFFEELKDLILSGEKTETWRIKKGFNSRYKEGNVLRIRVTQSGDEFAKIRIVKVWQESIKQIFSSNDFGGHEKYSTMNEMINTFKKYYSDEEITEKTLITRIKFELI